MTQIYDVLKKEHDEVKQLLGKMTDKQPSRKQIDDLHTMLSAHTKAEEQTLYKDLMQQKQTHELVLEGFEEHHVADMILQEIMKLEPSDERCAAKLKVLQENVEHHIKEEEKHMFPQARKAMDKEWAEQMTQQFEMQEQQLKQQMH